MIDIKTYIIESLRSQPIEPQPCVQHAVSTQSQANPIQTRTGSVGLPSDMVFEGGQTPTYLESGVSEFESDQKLRDSGSYLDELMLRLGAFGPQAASARCILMYANEALGAEKRKRDDEDAVHVRVSNEWRARALKAEAELATLKHVHRPVEIDG